MLVIGGLIQDHFHLDYNLEKTEFGGMLNLKYVKRFNVFEEEKFLLFCNSVNNTFFLENPDVLIKQKLFNTEDRLLYIGVGSEVHCHYEIKKYADQLTQYGNVKLATRIVQYEPLDWKTLALCLNTVEAMRETTVLLYDYEDNNDDRLQITHGIVPRFQNVIVATRWPEKYVKEKVTIVCNEKEVLAKLVVSGRKALYPAECNLEYTELARDLGAGDIFAYGIARFIQTCGKAFDNNYSSAIKYAHELVSETFTKGE